MTRSSEHRRIARPYVPLLWLGPMLLPSLLLLTGADWRQFRGTDNRSVAPARALSSSWDIATPAAWEAAKQQGWEADLPGRGPASPIVVGDRVIVTASSGAHQDELHVICFDAKTGKRCWQRRFWATGRTLCHPTSAVAAPTPASDGRRIFAFYSSCDLACFDLDGNLLWYRGLAEDYPRIGNDTGMSSSPLVVDDTVMVQMESQGKSLLVGIDVVTGMNRWQHPRRSMENWTSPVLYRPVPTAGHEKLPDLGLLQSPWGLTLIDPRTGRIRWQYEVPCEGIPSLTVNEGVLYVPAAGMTVLRPSGQAGHAKVLEVVWRESRFRTDAASPVVDRDRLYTLNNTGVLTCSESTTGRIVWRLRLEGRFWATPVLVGSRLILVNSDGLVQVVDVSGAKGKRVGTGDFGEPIQATPAVADGSLYFRSDRHLWKIRPLSQR